MESDIIGRIVFLVFLLAVPVGVVFLQIYLSKQDSKWPGLILPVITFLISLMVVLGFAVFEQTRMTSVTQYFDGEEWIVVEETVSETGREVIPGAVGSVVFMFFYMNVPTAILLSIYKLTKSKYNRQKALEKMSVQDLE